MSRQLTSGVLGRRKKTYLLNFDGVDDYVQINPTITFGIGQSLSMWINFNFTPGATVFYFIGGVSIFYGIGIHEYGFIVFTDQIGVTFCDWTKQDGYQHLVVTRETSSRYRYFINGVSIGTSLSTSGTGLDLVINRFMRRSDGRYVKGIISDFRHYDYELTSSDINNIMQKRAAGDEVGLLEYYRIDEGEGTVTLGEKGGEGTIFGATWEKAESDFPL